MATPRDPVGGPGAANGAEGAGAGGHAVDVTVVVPVRDGAAHLGAALDALAAQALDEPWALVVADDGSTDASVALAREHRVGDVARVRVLEHPVATGPNAARNRGIAAGEGRLVVLTDADDVVAPGWLAAHVAALRGADGPAGALSGGPIDQARLNPTAVQALSLPYDGPTRTATGVPWVLGTNLGLHRSVWERLGGFDETFRVGGDEVELQLRAHRAGVAFVWAPGARVHYRLRTSRAAWARQSRARGYGNRRLARQFPLEVVGTPTVPPVPWRPALGSVWRAARVRDRVGVERGWLDVVAQVGATRYELDRRLGRVPSAGPVGPAGTVAPGVAP